MFGSLLLPAAASAHEVYVLPADVVRQAIARPSFSEWNVIVSNINLFLFWAFIAGLVVCIVFFISVSRLLERSFDPFLASLRRYAPIISRVTVGLSFIAAAYYGALFGPELPLGADFGSAAGAVRVLLAVLGVALVFGVYARSAALAALGLFVMEVAAHGTYLLTYANYLGEIIVLFILGAHAFGRGRENAARWLARLRDRSTPYAFPILRVAFGISLIYASMYAKVIHNNLALEVAYRYPAVTHFFGFEPHFLVLGAAIIEILIGTFFVLGIEIRFTSLFMLFWLSLSLWYFGEAVWPHLILIGIPIAFIFYGYDTYSLEGRFFKKKGREPVL
ncbi:hypothetical protein KGQ72_00715 [Patescibacteria group bacterium]|nr:hypothetical protein [Patescibacteria group bacterium]